ncbi:MULTISPECIES: hypothetical protein [unclassified Microcoleus]|uniref:hypothetical protein n=1 Tax=unclassified Microcoleus TaxID=2642155 RepID=UPI002FD3C3D2
MPGLQRVDFFAGSRGWASCPPVKGLLTTVQDVSCIKQHRSFGVANIFLIDPISLKYNALISSGILSEKASISYTKNTDLSGARRPKNEIGN